MLRGVDLGINDTTLSVTIGGEACSPIVLHNHTTIVCDTPPGSAIDAPVSVSVAGLLSNQMSFRYLPPSLDFVTPADIATSGVNITLVGKP